MILKQQEFREGPEFSEKDIQNITGMMNGQPPATPGEGGGGAGGGAGEGAGAKPGAEGAAPGAGAGAPKPGAEGQGGAAAGAPGAKPGEGAGAAPGTGAEPPFNVESLGFKTVDEIKALRENFTKVQNELNEAKNAEPKFASERAKLLYDWANKHEGMETEAALRYLEIASLDLTKQADHQLRFRAFQLRPDVKGLSQEEIASLFAAEEIEKFGNPNAEGGQTEIQKIRAKQATASASEQLTKLQKEYTGAQGAQRTPEEIATEKADYESHVKKGLAGFAGIQLKLSATLEDGKKAEGSLNFKLDAEKQLPAIVDAVVDPAGWWEGYLNRQSVLAADKEQPDVLKFAEIVSWMEHKEDLLNQSYTQGRHDQLAAMAAAHRNGSGGEGAGGSGEGGGAPPPKSEKQEEMEGAMKVIGLKT